METKPTHEQAQLQLQLYDMRREARMRQGRDWYFRNYFPQTFEESMRIAGFGTENGQLVMMVWSYWEQACAMLNHGLLHEDLFFETSGEFWGVWGRVEPIIQQCRQTFSNKNWLVNLEKAAKRFESWMETRSPGHLATMRQFMKQMLDKQATATKA